MNIPPVVRPYGRLDSEIGLNLQFEIAKMLLKTPPLCVVDMAHVDAIDSTGLRFLTTSFKVAYEQKCRLVLCNLQPPLRIVFEISQLDRVFEIFESFEGILNSETIPVQAR